ncbi:MAG: hypothetical protein U1F54_04635 [Burkholderiales bacterium]
MPPNGSQTLLARVIPMGLKNAPVVTKFAIGALVVFVVTTVVLSLGVAPSILFPATVGVIVIGLLAVLAASAVRGVRNRRLADLFAWVVVLLFVAITVLLISSAFFGTPPAGARLLAKWLDDPALLPTQGKRQEIRVETDRSWSTLPESLRTPTLGANRMALSEELGSRPDLVVVGARLVIDANAGSSTIAVRSLTLRNAEVVTNGTTVTIEALEVISDDGSVVSYRDATLVSATGAGTSGGRVTLVIAGSLRGNLKVQLPGQGGKDGANGNAGGKGAAGAPGNNAASGLIDCQRGAGNGGPGQSGGKGEDGTPGANGGNGGDLVIRAKNPEPVVQAIAFSAPGGGGGVGGKGGAGGPGGDGGRGGSPVGLCSGSGQTGPGGPQGPPGSDGKPGTSGSAGRISSQVLA